MRSEGAARDAERLARAVLSRGSEPGDLTTASLVEQLGANRALDELLVPKANSALSSRLASVDPVQELEEADRHGIRFVIPGDPEWPASLFDLADPELQGLGGVPVGLWVKGPLSLRALDESVAIVGSRACSVYGIEVAGGMASLVSRAGIPVVSGGAAGIDAAAHRGALAAGGRTVAVMARGLDRAYPLSNSRLLGDIATQHALVSEVPHGKSPTRIRFLSRNRLIAALTRATVLVEAAFRSGALNTASWADELSRDVLAVPGPVTSVSSQGVHHRIREGGARLVTHGLEVLEHLGHAGEHLVEVPRGPERPRDGLSRADLRVVESLPAHRPAPVDEVAHEAGLHIRDADSALRRLSELGFVIHTDTGWQLLPDR